MLTIRLPGVSVAGTNLSPVTHAISLLLDCCPSRLLLLLLANTTTASCHCLCVCLCIGDAHMGSEILLRLAYARSGMAATAAHRHGLPRVSRDQPRAARHMARVATPGAIRVLLRAAQFQRVVSALAGTDGEGERESERLCLWLWACLAYTFFYRPGARKHTFPPAAPDDGRLAHHDAAITARFASCRTERHRLPLSNLWR